jgi:hypothetical protein
LISVDLPDDLLVIGWRAFEGCVSLFHVAIPEGVLFIAKDASLSCPAIIPRMKPSAEIEAQLEERIKRKTPETSQENLLIPNCDESPYALLCCAEEDQQRVSKRIIPLYWEGFSVRYERNPDQQTITDSACILVFFSEQTSDAAPAMALLKQAIKRDVSRIIQVFLDACTDWPEDVRHQLQDRQAILQSLCTEQEFEGRIRQSLHAFNCNAGHPRGFEMKKTGDGAEIVRFHPTGFPHVVIPKTFFDPPLPVTSIGASAFDAESGVAAAVSAFDDCKKLQSIKIPDSVTSIGDYAFRKCQALAEIDLPDGLQSIGIQAFDRCMSLTGIRIPHGIKNIEKLAFRSLISLTEVTIPEGVTSIGAGAFDNCRSLSGVDIPQGVTSIGRGAFEGCKSLTYANIPTSVINIALEAFRWCGSLSSVTIPNNATKIEKDAFLGCDKLTIRCPKGSKAWEYAFWHRIKRKPL